MKRMFGVFLASAAVSLVVVTPVVAENNADGRGRLASSDDLPEAQRTIRDAADVYRAVVKENKIPDSVLRDAQCVAVFPGVVTAAVGIGGTHGDGVAFCRSAAQGWGSPAFLNLTGGSLGIQAGVTSSDVVLFMTGENARREIERGEFALTGELSAVAGSFERDYVAPRAGVVAYRRTEGVFAGATLQGVNISRDKDDERNFYGGEGTTSVFERSVPKAVDETVRELRGMLPKGV